MANAPETDALWSDLVEKANAIQNGLPTLELMMGGGPRGNVKTMIDSIEFGLDLFKDVGNMREMASTLKHQLDNQEIERNSRNVELEALRAEQNTQATELTQLQVQKTALEVEISGLQQSKTDVVLLKFEKNSLEVEVSSLKRQEETLKAELSSLKHELDAGKEQFESIQAQFQAKRNSAGDLSSRIQAVETRELTTWQVEAELKETLVEVILSKKLVEKKQQDLNQWRRTEEHRRLKQSQKEESLRTELETRLDSVKLSQQTTRQVDKALKKTLMEVIVSKALFEKAQKDLEKTRQDDKARRHELSTQESQFQKDLQAYERKATMVNKQEVSNLQAAKDTQKVLELVASSSQRVDKIYVDLTAERARVKSQGVILEVRHAHIMRIMKDLVGIPSSPQTQSLEQLAQATVTEMNRLKDRLAEVTQLLQVEKRDLHESRLNMIAMRDARDHAIAAKESEHRESRSNKRKAEEFEEHHRSSTRRCQGLEVANTELADIVKGYRRQIEDAKATAAQNESELRNALEKTQSEATLARSKLERFQATEAELTEIRNDSVLKRAQMDEERETALRRELEAIDKAAEHLARERDSLRTEREELDGQRLEMEIRRDAERVNAREDLLVMQDLRDRSQAALRRAGRPFNRYLGR
jgi:hypothetical protein